MRPQPRDPFEPVSLRIEYVDSAAGSNKTTMAIAQAAEAAARGAKTIFAMPTEALIQEWSETVRRDHPAVVVRVIVSKPGSRITVPEAICTHIAAVNNGHILFITHEGLVRVTAWPERVNEYHLVVDEILDVILTRRPLRVHYSYFQLPWFLDIAPMPASLPERKVTGGDHSGEWTDKDKQQFTQGYARARGYLRSMDPAAEEQAPGVLKQLWALIAKQKALGCAEWTPEDAEDVDWAVKRLSAHRANGMMAALNPESQSAEQAEQAERQAALLIGWIQTLQAKQKAAAEPGGPMPLTVSAAPYYRLVPKPSTRNPKHPYWETELRARSGPRDMVHETFEPVPLWLTEGACLFTDLARWNRMIGLGLLPGTRRPYDAGLITISGFRRPDFLAGFERVTMMSALFRHTMLYALWDKLGVEFVPSTDIPLTVRTTPLGLRKLRIYWLSEHGWSKKARDKAGGIKVILDLIHQAEVIDPAKTACVVVNKDDGDPDNSGGVRAVFPNGMVLPHNTRGRNEFRVYDQLIYCAALNSHTADIRWLEEVLGIDASDQRIARLGQEVYQTLMRLSLREPGSTADITLVVMDRDVAEWLVQWFEPADQVEVFEIDSSGIITPHGGKGGRPLIGERPMTAAERKARSRALRRGELPADKGPSP
jgi:hypothetical protein